MRLWVIASIALLAAKACSVGTSSLPSPAGRSPWPYVSNVPYGCGSTQAYVGGVPAWLDEAGGQNNPDSLPYVITNPPIAAAFLFASPLRAGHPTNPANKILWVVAEPRNGTALNIVGHPVGSEVPVIQDSEPANSGPGEIYPSIVDVPAPGCWHFNLSWAGHTAAVELLYV
jgi:hypothetical protein